MSVALSASAGSEVVDVVELFVAGAGDEAALVVDAFTNVSGELSLVLVDGAAGIAGEVAGFVWESALGAVWRVPAALGFEAGVGEPICASERVMAPSNAAVPQIRYLKRLNII